MITEEQIWNYLDGGLNEDGRKEVEYTLTTDKQTGNLFKQISALHHSLKEGALLAPSVSFTDKVMASINVAPAQTSAKISLKLILIFTLPMICAIAACIGFLLYHNIPLSYGIPFQLPLPDFKNLQLYFIVADILLMAFFIDSLLQHGVNRKPLFS